MSDFTAKWQDMFKNEFLNQFTRVEGDELGAMVRTDGVQVQFVVEKWRKEGFASPDDVSPQFARCRHGFTVRVSRDCQANGV